MTLCVGTGLTWADGVLRLDSPQADSGAPAVVEASSGRVWSYRMLGDEIERTVAALSGGRGVLLALVRNDAPSLFAYLGGLAAGHAVLPLSSTTHPDLIRGLVREYQPEHILAPDDLALRFEGEGMPEYRLCGEVRAGSCVWRSTDGEQPPPHPDLSLLLSTSGSTGSPKLVRLSRRNVLSNADSIRQALGIGPLERACTSLSFSYSFGLSVIHSHLLAGACVVVTHHGLTERGFWVDLREQRCTSLSCVPYMFDMLRRVGFERMELPDLRTLAQAGGKLGDAMILRFHQAMSTRGGRLVVMYGQTEATARISWLPPELLPAKLGSVGYAIPGGRIRIVDEGGHAGGTAAVGEVEYTGPNVMMGYGTSRAELALGDELDGVLRTGDVGYVDGDGCLFIVGRRKRFAKVFGLRVSLDDVEARLHSAGQVAALDGGDSVIVCCTHAAEGAVRDQVKQVTAMLRLPAAGLRIRVLNALPTLANGKPDYEGIRSLAGLAQGSLS